MLALIALSAVDMQETERTLLDVNGTAPVADIRTDFRHPEAMLQTLHFNSVNACKRNC